MVLDLKEDGHTSLWMSPYNPLWIRRRWRTRRDVTIWDGQRATSVQLSITRRIVLRGSTNNVVLRRPCTPAWLPACQPICPPALLSRVGRLADWEARKKFSSACSRANAAKAKQQGRGSFIPRFSFKRCLTGCYWSPTTDVWWQRIC